MGFITISLKLYKPSKIKKDIMDNALDAYSRAFAFLVDKGLENLPLLQKLSLEKGSQNKIAKWCSKTLGKELNNFGVEPFKDSIVIDFAIFILGFLTNNKGKALNIEGKIRPVYFCRTAPNRDFSLLYDSDRERFFIKLYLLNRNSGFKRVQTSEDRGLIYVNSNGGILKSSGKKERFIIVPLAFGKWQENYLKKALDNPTLIKTGRLKKIGSEYFIDVSIEAGEPEAYKPVTYIAITRGVVSPLNYAIVDKNRKLIVEAVLLKKEELEGGCSRQQIFQTANKICEIAKKNQSAVIMEKLDFRSDYLNYKDKKDQLYVSAFSKENYNQLVRILKYKLPMAGCGKMFELSPLDIFYRCHICNKYSRKNRFSFELFICASCATSMEIDRLGSINLAMKLLKYSETKIKIKSRIVENSIVFTNEDLDFRCECPLDKQDYIEFIAEELKKVSVSIDVLRGLSKKKQSLIMKIKSSQDLTRVIEIL